MKKAYKILLIIMGIFVLLFGIAAFYILQNEYSIPLEIREQYKKIIVFGCLIVIALVLVCCGIEIIQIAKNGLHNMRECDDELFMEIDKYKKRWKESDKYYERQIQVINLYYADNGKVDEVIKKRELSRLFVRMDFLSMRSSFYDTAMTYLYSLVISVIAAFVCKIMECNNIIYVSLLVALVFISFFVLLLFRYAKRGEDGSFQFFVDEYERKLLAQKIENIEKEITITKEDEEIIRTKQLVINILIGLREKAKKSKEKEQLEHDIECLEGLQLCLGDYSGYYKKQIKIKQEEGILVYSEERGKESNYTDMASLISNDYKVLYEILERYGLIDGHQQLMDEKGMGMKDKIKRFFLFEKMKICISIIVFLFLLQMLFALSFEYLVNLEGFNLRICYYWMYIVAIILALSVAVIDFGMKKEVVNGICFRVMEACLEREQYKRFQDVKRCIQSFKNEKDEKYDVKENVKVIEAAIAYDQAFAVVFPVFVTIVSVVFFDTLGEYFQIGIVGWVGSLLLVSACYLLISMPQNAFIKAVIEDIKKEIEKESKA